MTEQATKNKKPWESKTIWVNAVTALLAFIPGVSQWVSDEMILTFVAVANIALRLITKDKVVMKD